MMDEFYKFVAFSLFVFMMGLIISCTLSFQNISTHGTATDLVDENQSPTNDIKPNIQIPAL